MESKKPSLKTRSYASCTSKRLSHSSTGAAAAMARAKAEAAKARLSYAEEEMKIKLEKAKLEATMEMLALEKETAAAEAQAAVLEAAADGSEGRGSELQLEETPLDPAQRTRNYVVEQAVQQEIEQSVQRMDSIFTNEAPQLHTEPAPECSNEGVRFKSENSPNSGDFKRENANRNEAQQPCVDTGMPRSLRNLHATPNLSRPQPFSDAPPFSSESKYKPQHQHTDNMHMSDFVRYFARRELVTTGLIQFDDKPDSYRAWQRSFQNAVRGLDLTPSEEMDLLVKWLGRESSEHAKRIRSVHINRPDKGLRMIWTRLDECYGAPEVIETALFQRIDNFPKISNRDYPKLRELSDLLMELEAAMADGDLTGLSYLNTARGIHPIVQKLPFCLQEKWLSVGSSFKLQYAVSFPPFEVFVDFICEQARIRNDPSFKLQGPVESPTRQDKTDEQSNRSLARSEFFDIFDIQSPNTPYSLRTCSGITETLGRRACGFYIESLDGKVSLPLPNLIECNDIPNNRQEIPTPDVAMSYPHLKSIAHLIPELDPKAYIMLLLGRDIIQVHKVRKRLNGPNDAPYAQMLDLGWVIVGNSCLGSVHKPATVDVLFTRMYEKGHSSIFEPCPNVFHVKERYAETPQPTTKCSPGSTLFEQDTYELVNPLTDAAIRPQVSTLATTLTSTQLGSQRFSKFSRWKSLTHGIARLIHITRHFHKSQDTSTTRCKGWHHCEMAPTVDELMQSEKTVIRSVQEDSYAQEYDCLKNNKILPKDSPLKALSPFIDSDGLLRVGGRIQEAKIPQNEKNPLIIPGKHHVATLLIRHHHERVQHQGRLFTEGAVRTAGLWIVGGKRQVNNILRGCVMCRRLRGTVVTQKMADLPSDRVSPEAPFTNVGLDVFGPWTVSSRRTRGGLAHSKRWAVMFTCMSVRAIHIEVIESLDTSSFINALRRFIAVRGPVKLIRSDQGTNFTSACKELNIPSNIDNVSVEKFLVDHGCTWKFNPPHAPHMGGSWERMIGVTKRILDSVFLQAGSSKLTHETLTTLMAEVTAIVNSRPLIPVSTDPDDSLILSPAMLLTQKVNLPSAPVGDWVKDIYKVQWHQVQHLAQMFWDKWRKQYLSSLQPRRKWQDSQPDLKTGSIVILKDEHLKRYEWPLGLVTQVFPSGDGKVRTVEVKVVKTGRITTFTRPISETVLLLEPEKKAL